MAGFGWQADLVCWPDNQQFLRWTLQSCKCHQEEGRVRYKARVVQINFFCVKLPVSADCKSLSWLYGKELVLFCSAVLCATQISYYYHTNQTINCPSLIAKQDSLLSLDSFLKHWSEGQMVYQEALSSKWGILSSDISLLLNSLIKSKEQLKRRTNVQGLYLKSHFNKKSWRSKNIPLCWVHQSVLLVYHTAATHLYIQLPRDWNFFTCTQAADQPLRGAYYR